jgi:outer membrane lipoprotein-sorting protein
MRHIAAIIILITTGLPGILLAQNPQRLPLQEPEPVIQAMNMRAGVTKTITADFNQVKFMGFMDDSVKSSGKFYFKMEKQLRWEYLEPYKYAIIMDNMRFGIIDEGKSKEYDASSSKIFFELSDILSGIVDGSLLKSNKFNALWYEAPDSYQVDLTPTNANLKEFITMIVILVDKTDYSVDGVKLMEATGDLTNITFLNKKFNEDIPASTFTGQ